MISLKFMIFLDPKPLSESRSAKKSPANVVHRLTRRGVLACSLVAALMAGTSVGLAEDKKPADKEEAKKITFEDHILPIFRQKCGSCHGADDAKGGLVVDNYTRLMEGGASGEVVEAGDAELSYLYSLVNHELEPYMPPSQPKLPEEELALIRTWIEGGALENAQSKSNVKAKPKMSLGKIDVSSARPDGPPPMPEGLSTEPVSVLTRGNSVTALAASPWSPLVAVSSHKQVLLYSLDNFLLRGVLPFPEGTPHVLKFSRNGSLLLAGGGRGGQSGLVVVWDVRTGERVFEVGAEYDVVLAADISSDHSLIALGGPRKMLRVYSTESGELVYESKKHTDWITAIEFSPDGVLLASGDRSNGLVVWEAYTGREFYFLKGHGDMITDLSWRLDSNVLASSSNDGSIRLWEMQNGGQIRSINSHGGGASAVQFTPEGELVSTGRDRVSKRWDQAGKELGKMPALEGFGLQVTYAADQKQLIAGDLKGIIRVWNAENGEQLAELASNPQPLAVRLESAQEAAQRAEREAEQAAARLAKLKQDASDRQAKAEAAQKQAAQAAESLKKATAANAAAEKAAGEKSAAWKKSEAVLTQAQKAFEKARNDSEQADGALAGAAKKAKQAVESQQAVAEMLTAKIQAAQAMIKAAEALKTAQQSLASAQDEHKQSAEAKAASEQAAKDAAAALDKAKQQAAASQKAAEAAVAAAKPTPESTKALEEAEAAAKSAAERANELKAVVDQLASEKSRTSNEQAAVTKE